MLTDSGLTWILEYRTMISWQQSTLFRFIFAFEIVTDFLFADLLATIALLLLLAFVFTYTHGLPFHSFFRTNILDEPSVTRSAKL